MKKNTMMRIASVLMVAVLLSTCAISSTFAKYVSSDSATDTARIAKWGVEVTATGNAFNVEYQKKNDNTSYSVVSKDKNSTDEAVIKNILAPGTSGEFGGFSITGSPEVLVDISVTADLNLSTWTLSNGTEYCPLVFTFGPENDRTSYQIGGTYNNGTTDVSIDSLQKLEEAVEYQFTKLSASSVAANSTIDRGTSFSWSWPFESNDDANANDTKLGDLDTAPTIAFNCNITVTQVD